MVLYILRRTLMLVPIVIVMSMVAFFLIQLPPGDYVSFRIQQLKMSGVEVSASEAELLKLQFGLDKPPHSTLFPMGLGHRHCVGTGATRCSGRSRSAEILAERVPMTVAISLAALFFSWIVAIPIGIYSATHQYSRRGLCVYLSGFYWGGHAGLLAGVDRWPGSCLSTFNFSVTGLFSNEFIDAAWSVAKVLDLLKHMWLPLILVGLGQYRRHHPRGAQ